ncbi:MAG: molybdenum cofactor guanylyltransferase [Candidatus Freyarchaeota archaeon]|nr:molybdenum cofactor guanylyltransferase [Candidatus Freyrarchaeum guaymaensis]HDO81278.1 molybdenum cofactor guanylyltransferase [Candidatus Bathyarchaeota archaeon]
MGKLSVAVLSGGASSRMGGEKGLVALAGKPMVAYVVEACRRLSEEVLVVVDPEKVREYEKVLPSHVAVVPDETAAFKSPLVGVYTALSSCSGKYLMVLPCDAPLAKVAVLSFLKELAHGWDAVIPRWPNGFIEPLIAVYSVKRSLNASREALRRGRRDMRGLIEQLKPLYVSTLTLQALDPELETFFNVNTPKDLRVAEEKLIKRSLHV